MGSKFAQKYTWITYGDPLLKNCPYSELFWSLFSRILGIWECSECGKIQTRIIPNMDMFHAANHYAFMQLGHVSRKENPCEKTYVNN